MSAPGRVVFVGASITEGWDFDAHFPGRDFRKVVHYEAGYARLGTVVLPALESAGL